MEAKSDDGPPPLVRRRSSLQRMAKSLPEPVKKVFGIGSKKRRSVAEAKERERLTTEADQEASEGDAEDEESDDEPAIMDFDDQQHDHFLAEAAAERLYLEEEIRAAQGAREAAAAYWARNPKPEEEQVPNCFPFDEEGQTDGEEDEEKVSYWASLWQKDPVDPDDPLAAYEVLVGDKDEPIENHEWVLAVSHENLTEGVEYEDGTAGEKLIAMKFKFEHGFVITVEAADFDTKTRRIKLSEPLKLICLPEKEEEEEEEKEEEEEEKEEEGHPIGFGEGILEKLWRKEPEPEPEPEYESEEEAPVGTGGALFEKLWKKEGDPEWSCSSLFPPEPEAEFKIGEVVEVRGLFGLDYNQTWRKGKVVGFTEYVPAPAPEEEEEEEEEDYDISEFQNAGHGDGKISRPELAAYIKKKDSEKLKKDAARAMDEASFIKKPLVKIDKWGEVYEFEECRKCTTMDEDEEVDAAEKNVNCSEWTAVDMMTLGMSRRPTYVVGQRVEVRGLYGLPFLEQWRRGEVMAIEPQEGEEGQKTSPHTPLVKLGMWDEHYVFNEVRPVTAFKEYRKAYSGMSYQELLDKQAELNMQVLPMPDTVVCQ